MMDAVDHDQCSSLYVLCFSETFLRCVRVKMVISIEKSIIFCSFKFEKSKLFPNTWLECYCKQITVFIFYLAKFDHMIL